MASKIKIDGIDKIIIKRLVEDARTPILSIAREVGISGAAIHQRLRKLESSDLMAGSKLILNPKLITKLGENLYNTVNGTYDMKSVCKNRKELYEKLISEKKVKFVDLVK